MVVYPTATGRLCATTVCRKILGLGLIGGRIIRGCITPYDTVLYHRGVMTGCMTPRIIGIIMSNSLIYPIYATAAWSVILREQLQNVPSETPTSEFPIANLNFLLHAPITWISNCPRAFRHRSICSSWSLKPKVDQDSEFPTTSAPGSAKGKGNLDKTNDSQPQRQDHQSGRRTRRMLSADSDVLSLARWLGVSGCDC